MGMFETVVQAMAGMDVFQLFFPWLLMLAVVYGVLEKYNVFSDEPGVNGVIAMSVAFLSIGGAYFYLPQGILTSLAAGITFSLFGILGFMILLAVAGFDLTSETLSDDPFSLPAIGALVFAILSFLGAFVFTAPVDQLLAGVENAFSEVIMPILVLVFLIVIVALTMEGGGD